MAARALLLIGSRGDRMQVILMQSRVSALNSDRFSPRRPHMLRIQTSFQDTPGDGYYFVLIYDERPLVEQVETLGLRDGDAVILWEPGCGTSKLRLYLELRRLRFLAPKRLGAPPAFAP